MVHILFFFMRVTLRCNGKEWRSDWKIVMFIESNLFSEYLSCIFTLFFFLFYGILRTVRVFLVHVGQLLACHFFFFFFFCELFLRAMHSF